jgi:plastocyanin
MLTPRFQAKATALPDGRVLVAGGRTFASTSSIEIYDPNVVTATVPDAPSNIVAAAGDAQASVSWTAPASDGGSAIQSYTVTSAPGSFTATVGAGATSATVGGLANGTSYSFTVVATNTVGPSVAGGPSNAVTPAAGAPPPSSASGTVGAGGSVATGTTPNASAPVSAAVTTPTGGTITIAVGGTADPAPGGYVFGQQQIDITAPPTTATQPLTIVFTIYPTVGQTPETTSIYRTETGGSPTLLPNCDAANPAQAVPFDPCVTTSRDTSGTLIVATILTSHASRWNEATPVPATVRVADSGYVPAQTTVRLGGAVTWTFVGKKSHSATESVGLGAGGAPLFNSGVRKSGTYTSPSVFAAGTYAYKSTVSGDTMSGAVLVPLQIVPTGSTGAATFAVIWATSGRSGYVFDVQNRFKPAGSKKWGNWIKWKMGTAAPAASFQPTLGAGVYDFVAHLRNSSTGRSTADSPETTITTTH